MKKLYVTFALLAMFALVVSACAPAQPANRLEAVKQAGKITVGTSPDYPPFESKDASGNFIGFDIDLMKEIGKRMGVTVEFVDMPFDSLVAAVQTGKVDASISAFNYDEERAKKVDFSESYYVAKDAFLVAEGFSGTIAAPEDIAALKVGAGNGTTQDGWITENLVDTGLLPETNYSRYDRIDQAALDVKSGRIDVLMGDNIPMAEFVKTLGGLKIAYETDVSSGPVMMITPKDEEELLAAINEQIVALKKEGFIDQLAANWFK